MRYKRKFLNWVQHFQFHSVTVITNLSYLCIVFQYSLIPCDKVCKMYFFYIRSHFFKEAHSRSKEHRLSCIDIRCGPFFISSCIIPLLRCSRETIRLKASKQILRFVFFFYFFLGLCQKFPLQESFSLYLWTVSGRSFHWLSRFVFCPVCPVHPLLAVVCF